MKVKIIKTGEILDLEFRDAQRRIMQGKAMEVKEVAIPTVFSDEEIVKLNEQAIEEKPKKGKLKKNVKKSFTESPYNL